MLKNIIWLVVMFLSVSSIHLAIYRISTIKFHQCSMVKMKCLTKSVFPRTNVNISIKVMCKNFTSKVSHKRLWLTKNVSLCNMHSFTLLLKCPPIDLISVISQWSKFNHCQNKQKFYQFYKICFELSCIF